jgi:hypothetical protein
MSFSKEWNNKRMGRLSKAGYQKLDKAVAIK